MISDVFVMTPAFPSKSIWNRIITAAAKRMAPQQPCHRHPQSFERTMLFERFNRIIRTAWHKAALPANPACQRKLIKPDEQDEKPGQARFTSRFGTPLEQLTSISCKEPADTIAQNVAPISWQQKALPDLRLFSKTSDTAS